MAMSEGWPSMSAQESALGDSEGAFFKHLRIIWALIMREVAARYGRTGLGFLWLVIEPLCFATGIAFMWSWDKPKWDETVGVTAFVLSGYLGLVMHRQTIGHCVTSVRANTSLLYHRQITPLHLFLAKSLTEFIGVTLAGCVAVFVAMLTGLMPLLQNFQDLGLVFAGWALIWLEANAIALCLVALASMFEWVERVANVANYLALPLTGAFYILAWLPVQIRPVLLSLPFIHGWEILRKGFFGTNIESMWNLPVAFTWLIGDTLLGLLLLNYARSRIEVE
jgi:capsular polysaccharide transport system permease protein